MHTKLPLACMRLVLTLQYAKRILPNMTGSDIIALRKRHGWSQSDLADQLGVNQTTVSRMEQGGKISRPISKLLMLLALKGGSKLPPVQGGVAQ